MAGTKQKEEKSSKEKKLRRKKRERHLPDQIEERYGGARTEVFSRISAKEAEIRSKISSERAQAERMIEDAKGQAAAIKRKAAMEEIGKDAYAKIVAQAREEIKEIELSTVKEIEAVKKSGEKNLDKAVEFIVEAVIRAGSQV